MANPIIITDENIQHFKIDSPNKAYSLGFLWGDGHLKSYTIANGISNIYYPELEIVKNDLLEIIDLFKSWGEWSLRLRTRKNRKEQGIISNYDRYFGYYLKQNDYLIKSKVEPTKILNQIPNNLKQFWWRGFIDADGCFYNTKNVSQFSLSGNHQLTWQEINCLFNLLDINKFEIKYRTHNNSKGFFSKSSFVRVSNKKDIIKLGNYIYNDNPNIGLLRKYNKFLEIKNK